MTSPCVTRERAEQQQERGLVLGAGHLSVGEQGQYDRSGERLLSVRAGEGCPGSWEFSNSATVHGGVRWEGAVGPTRHAFSVQKVTCT